MFDGPGDVDLAVAPAGLDEAVLDEEDGGGVSPVREEDLLARSHPALGGGQVEADLPRDGEPAGRAHLLGSGDGAVGGGGVVDEVEEGDEGVVVQLGRGGEVQWERHGPGVHYHTVSARSS